MKNQELKTPIVVAIVVIVVGVAAFFGYRAMSSAGDLDQGQVKYTPGKPPWLETDPNKKGPGASPGAGVAGAPQQNGGSTAQTAPPQAPNMPVGPPTVNNNGSK